MRKPLKRRTRENLVGWSFLALWAFGFLVFTMIPLFTSLYYSLSDVVLDGEGIKVTFVGFDNYKAIFSSSEGFNFLRSVGDFAIEILFKVPIITVFAIIIAVLLNQNIKGKGFFRAIYFLPVIIASGPVINQLIYQGAATVPIVEEMGILELINNTFTEGLARPIASIFSELIVILWFSGVQILLFIAALQKIDKSTYEAAMIDGAGPWESFWKITVPGLSQMVLVSIVFTIINLATFSENEAILHIKNNMFALETGFGFSSAIAWLYFIALVIILGIFFLLFRGFSRERRNH
ncbi:carbohydrate ABC transporter permease [Candidatus Izemoplasma sp. B36]|uniref:carbohydrate ABC transporter permease n=1 Tax=Candidatus Izemoplasma sp. B36 TaxID=3242468 RepID=UPI003555FC65